jgi:hypothetical protein
LFEILGKETDLKSGKNRFLSENVEHLQKEFQSKREALT